MDEAIRAKQFIKAIKNRLAELNPRSRVVGELLQVMERVVRVVEVLAADVDRLTARLELGLAGKEKIQIGGESRTPEEWRLLIKAHRDFVRRMRKMQLDAESFQLLHEITVRSGLEASYTPPVAAPLVESEEDDE